MQLRLMSKRNPPSKAAPMIPESHLETGLHRAAKAISSHRFWCDNKSGESLSFTLPHIKAGLICLIVLDQVNESWEVFHTW